MEGASVRPRYLESCNSPRIPRPCGRPALPSVTVVVKVRKASLSLAGFAAGRGFRRGARSTANSSSTAIEQLQDSGITALPEFCKSWISGIARFNGSPSCCSCAGLLTFLGSLALVVVLQRAFIQPADIALCAPGPGVVFLHQVRPDHERDFLTLGWRGGNYLHLARRPSATGFLATDFPGLRVWFGGLAWPL